MHFSLSHFLIRLVHALCWVVALLLLLSSIGMCLLAYGFDGSHLQPLFDKAIPKETGKLTIEHIAYWPGRGIMLKDVVFRNSEGKLIARCSRSIIGVRILTRDAWQDRITALQLDDLFVAQIQHDPDEPPDTLTDERPPYPDLSGIRLPYFDHIPLVLNNPDVLEVRLNRITGILTTNGGTLHFRDLKGEVDGVDQRVDASIDVNVHGGTVTAHIRGFIIQTRLNGIYRALDFPIIERYSNKFTLEKPAWADCTFTVGFDKYRNIFDLKVQISAKKGDYCGVWFDEAIGTIHCRGIWDAVTTIDPIIARRNGAIVAKGKLRFDCPKDRFFFEADGSGLSPKEALQLIDMPFTEAIPPMTAERAPEIRIRGDIPLLTEQTPAKVNLTGYIRSNAPYTFDNLRLSTVDTDLAMQNGIFHLKDLNAVCPLGGVIKGDVDIAIPNEATYTDVTAAVALKDVSLADLLQPFNMNTLTNCVTSGDVTLALRTDKTCKESLDADFDVVIEGGLIGRVPLFAGFTDLMADYVPGVSTITDTSVAKVKGTATKGVITIPHFTLSGNLFMIEGPVEYNLPKDHLQAKIIAGIFKKDTFIGSLTRWATVPVTKLLWELEVTGPIASPKWNNITIVEKIWDKIPFTGGSNAESKK